MKNSKLFYGMFAAVLLLLSIAVLGLNGCTTSGSGRFGVIPSPAPTLTTPQPEDDTGTLSGTVQDSSNGEPVQDATVTCNGVNTTTDNEGKFTLENIPLDQKVAVTVTITKDGFEIATFEVNLGQGETVTLNQVIEMIPEEGKIVVFVSYAQLLPEDTDDKTDVYLKDLRTGKLELISVNSEGEKANNHSGMGSVNVGGRYVVFRSWATNLAEGTVGFSQIYIRDRINGVTEIVSAKADGTPGDSLSWEPRISGDGKWVVFTSSATNLVEAKFTKEVSSSYIYLKNLETGAFTMVSKTTSGDPATGESQFPSISGFGRYVTFTSNAPDLRTMPDYHQIYLYDRETDTVTGVSKNSDDEWGDSDAFYSQVSADGKKVVFSTRASNMIVSKARIASYRQVYVHDVETGEKTLVSVNTEGAPGDYDSYQCSINADGTKVSFRSAASDLLAKSGRPATQTQIYLRDLTSNTTSIVSVNDEGTASNGTHGMCPISLNGKYVFFESSGDNLVEGDTNGKKDVFMRDLENNTTSRISTKSDGAQADEDSLKYYEGAIVPPTTI